MPHDPLLGQTLGGNFQILELLGQGGMGRVYLAEQLSLERKVAVKVLHPHLCQQPLFVRRFWIEARAASRIMHPGCAAILHFGVEEERPYLVMEHLVGRSLAEALDNESLPSPARACSIVIDMLDALEEAHALGVVHRDIKPDNVFLAQRKGGGEVVKIVDFGIACLSAAGDGRGPTEPGATAGTPAYMSPEQCAGQPVDGRSDLYAVGVLLFEMLAGRTPFVSDEPMRVLVQHLTDLPPDLRQVRPDRSLPAALCELVAKALSKRPDDRFATAGEMREALAEVASALPPTSRRAPRASSPSLPGHAPQPTTQDGPERAVRELCAEVEKRLSDGVAVCLVGKPGSGKSAVLASLGSEAEANEERVVHLGPHPSHAPVPYWPIARLVAELTGREPASLLGDADGLGPLERAALREIVSPSGLAGPGARSRAPAVGSLLSALIASAAGGGTLWLLVDDLESFDAPSREAFGWLADERLPGLRLVAATSEPGRAFRQASQVSAPLGPSDSLSPLQAELAWAYGALPEGTTSLVQLVLLHLERLSPRARELAATAAVLGDEAPGSALRALCPEATPQALAELEASRLARLDGAGGVRMPRAVRLVVESALPAEARRRLHSRALAHLDEERAPLEVLALHAYEGSEPTIALALLAAAGAAAGRRGDHEAAVAFLGKRLERARAELLVTAEPLLEKVVARAARDLAQALLDAGRPAEGAGLLRELGGLDASPSERAARGLLAARCARRRGRLDEALARLEDARAVAGSETPALLRAESWLEEAEVRLAQGDAEGARGALDPLAPLIEQRVLGADTLPLIALRLGQLRARAGDVRAQKDLERAMGLARVERWSWHEAEALSSLATLEAERQAHGTAQALRAEARALWTAAGDRLRLSTEAGEWVGRSPTERPGPPAVAPALTPSPTSLAG